MGVWEVKKGTESLLNGCHREACREEPGSHVHAHTHSLVSTLEGTQP